MRFNGEWLICDDGAVRPVVRADIATGNDEWHSFDLLVDTGADRTVLSAHVWQELDLAETKRLGLLGGVVESVLFRGQLRFTRDDRQTVILRGDFAACLNDTSLDMSVLGRDILDMFVLIADRKRETLALIGGNRTYSIHSDVR